jgi:YidC/Oxa1 family membrane protein insertase
MVVVRMDDQNKNLLLATALSFMVILAWFVGGPMLFPQWFPEEPAVQQTAAPAAAPEATAAPATEDAATATSNEPAPEAPRVTIDTPKLSGSLSLAGGRIDDLLLKGYRETVDPTSPEVRLLSPVGKDHPYDAVFSWLAGNGLEPADVPNAKTVWSAAENVTLTPETPVTLTWQNTKGLTFTRTISIDADFMFTITDKVDNAGTAEARLAPIGIVARHDLPELQNNYIVHEGAVVYADGVYCERDYQGSSWFGGCSSFEDLSPSTEKDIEASNANQWQQETNEVTSGWIGFTDHYWMTALIPDDQPNTSLISKYVESKKQYQVEVRHEIIAIAPGASTEVTTRLYAGAKEWETIRTYQNDHGVVGFIDSIDWGWFYFLTKPIFALLHWLNATIGNMGLAIIALTFVLKILVLPLAYKSYVSMARMKELQPEMEAIKERAGDDKQKLQREIMQLYKDRKVNPAAGCLPILIQIPIFFALFKVISVTLELRHAAFFGWLNDLAAPDTSSLYNLFGLFPWDAPATGSLTHMIFIGILPIILGITMWMQQKLNPAPTDPIQQQIFAWMPWVFMFMMSTFASGLIVYWITNNTITFVQQYLIMASHGSRPDFFGNIKAGVKKPTAVSDKSKKK